MSNAVSNNKEFRFLLDECITHKKARPYLDALMLHTKDWPASFEYTVSLKGKGAKDEWVMSLARKTWRILLTRDKGFFNPQHVRIKNSHGVVILPNIYLAEALADVKNELMVRKSTMNSTVLLYRDTGIRDVWQDEKAQHLPPSRCFEASHQYATLDLTRMRV